jgi:hypothetical protein
VDDQEYTKEEIARRGREIYEREIRPRLDRDQDGRFLVVDVRTGRFEIADDELTAFDRAGQDNPDGLLFGLRVGSRAAHRLGGRLFAAG